MFPPLPAAAPAVETAPVVMLPAALVTEMA
jgi:hypothetical protein